MDSNIGRNLIRIVDSIPVLDAQTFDTLMTNQMNVIFSIGFFLTIFLLTRYIFLGFAYGFLFIKFSKSSIDSQREAGHIVVIWKNKQIIEYFKFIQIFMYLFIFMLQTVNKTIVNCHFKEKINLIKITSKNETIYFDSQ